MKPQTDALLVAVDISLAPGYKGKNMNTYARICSETKRVLEIIELEDTQDIKTLYHPDIKFVLCQNPEAIKIWTTFYYNEEFTDQHPPVSDEEAIKIRVYLYERIADIKKSKRDAGFLVDGVLFDSDAGARIAYVELESRFTANPECSILWKASNGNWINMTADLYQRVKEALAAHIQKAFKWQEQKEKRLAAASNEELVTLQHTLLEDNYHGV